MSTNAVDLKRHRSPTCPVDVVCPKMAKVSQRLFIVKSCEMNAYFRLLDDPLIFDFLVVDRCLRISDKYLLAMVFAYFKRAGLAIREYNRLNFFLALYLANDMEEDEEDNKYEIFPWILGKSWKTKYVCFLRKRDMFWQRIDYRAVVSRKCCEEVMSIVPDHPAWSRERSESHAGAFRPYMIDTEFYPLGPDKSPRYCHICDKDTEYDSACVEDETWYLSSCSDSSPDGPQTVKTVHIVPGSARFNMADLRESLDSKDKDDIWAKKSIEEE